MTAARKAGARRQLRIRTIKHVSIVETRGRVVRVPAGWQGYAHGMRIGRPQYDRMVAQRMVNDAMRMPDQPAPDYDMEWPLLTEAFDAYHDQQIWRDE